MRNLTFILFLDKIVRVVSGFVVSYFSYNFRFWQFNVSVHFATTSRFDDSNKATHGVTKCCDPMKLTISHQISPVVMKACYPDEIYPANIEDEVKRSRGFIHKDNESEKELQAKHIEEIREKIEHDKKMEKQYNDRFSETNQALYSKQMKYNEESNGIDHIHNVENQGSDPQMRHPATKETTQILGGKIPPSPGAVMKTGDNEESYAADMDQLKLSRSSNCNKKQMTMASQGIPEIAGNRKFLKETDGSCSGEKDVDSQEPDQFRISRKIAIVIPFRDRAKHYEIFMKHFQKLKEHFPRESTFFQYSCISLIFYHNPRETSSPW